MMKTTFVLAIAVGMLSQEVPAPELRSQQHVEEERSLLQQHYRRVIAELLAAPVTHDTTQQASRLETIDALREYCERGDFGRHPIDAGDDTDRKFLFVDDEGRRCAVAELLHAWGEDELVHAIAEQDNNALIAEVKHSAPFAAWLEEIGLSWAEAARIQAPGIRPGGGGNAGRTTRAPLPAPTGPRRGPRTGRRGRSSAAPAPTAPQTGRPSTARTVGPPAQTPGGIDDLMTHWWAWWEFNKLEWLVQERSLSFRPELASDRTSTETDGRKLRMEALPILAECLEDDDARVRAAATVAYGRLAGEDAVEAILANLEDPQHGVRIASILALGATGPGRGTHELMRLAFWGDSKPGKEIVPDVRPLAHLALGLSAQRSGGQEGAIFLPPSDGALRPGEATALYQFMAKSTSLLERMREVSGIFDKFGRPKRNMQDALPRGVEALRFDDPSEVQIALMHALGSRDLEVRRSAAATLGRLPSAEALPVLFTAFETEKEMLARGLILIAIGRQGGPEARDFLVHALRYGPKSARPWGALALGILSEKDGDQEAMKELRTAFSREKNANARGAYLLAFGISRDTKAHGILRLELTGKSDMSRANAALGLALSGDAEAGASLRRAFDKEPSPFAKSTIAQALGILGETEDVDLLISAMQEVDDPILVVQYAASLAFHGSAPSAASVLEALADERLAAAMKAGLVQALGMILDETPPFRFLALSSDANFAAFPDWLDAPLQSTL